MGKIVCEYEFIYHKDCELIEIYETTSTCSMFLDKHDIQRLNECLAAELPEPKEVYCEWRERDTEIDADKLYNTSCGKTSVMLAGGGYCNHCGRKRKIKQEVANGKDKSKETIF